MGDASSGRWVWWLLAAVAAAYLLVYRAPIENSLKPRLSPQGAVHDALGSEVQLDSPVRIRPRWLGEPGRRMAFKRVVICGRAVSPNRTTPVAVVYPLGRSSRAPSVVTPDNPDGSQNEGAFIGRAVLAECAMALGRASSDARKARQAPAA
ncbi:hypothetical protein [Brevundimonas sp. Root1423]|uniref:hypothetical protein n=1 Tax=Brevundimonas sp. Root1423 TaxID=1736462 RepID=UPI0006F3C2BA|nr:hypothetical protein [Brevundimonas sp. Root1423]KQY85055.1 hypothetical protein ASD25_08690 [Brevundimonas sp. Root1423]